MAGIAAIGATAGIGASPQIQGTTGAKAGQNASSANNFASLLAQSTGGHRHHHAGAQATTGNVQAASTTSASAGINIKA